MFNYKSLFLKTFLSSGILVISCNLLYASIAQNDAERALALKLARERKPMAEINDAILKLRQEKLEEVKVKADEELVKLEAEARKLGSSVSKKTVVDAAEYSKLKTMQKVLGAALEDLEKRGVGSGSGSKETKDLEEMLKNIASQLKEIKESTPGVPSGGGPMPSSTTTTSTTSTTPSASDVPMPPEGGPPPPMGGPMPPAGGPPPPGGTPPGSAPSALDPTEIDRRIVKELNNPLKIAQEAKFLEQDLLKTDPELAQCWLYFQSIVTKLIKYKECLKIDILKTGPKLYTWTQAIIDVKSRIEDVASKSRTEHKKILNELEANYEKLSKSLTKGCTKASYDVKTFVKDFELKEKEEDKTPKVIVKDSRKTDLAGSFMSAEDAKTTFENLVVEYNEKIDRELKSYKDLNDLEAELVSYFMKSYKTVMSELKHKSKSYKISPPLLKAIEEAAKKMSGLDAISLNQFKKDLVIKFMRYEVLTDLEEKFKEETNFSSQKVSEALASIEETLKKTGSGKSVRTALEERKKVLLKEQEYFSKGAVLIFRTDNPIVKEKEVVEREVKKLLPEAQKYLSK